MPHMRKGYPHLFLPEHHIGLLGLRQKYTWLALPRYLFLSASWDFVVNIEILWPHKVGKG